MADKDCSPGASGAARVHSTSGSVPGDGRAGGAAGAGSGSAVGRLLAFAGPRRALTYLGCALSAASMLVSFGPYV